MTIFSGPIPGARSQPCSDMSLLLEALRKAEKQSLRDRGDAVPQAHGAGRGSGAGAASAPTTADGLKENPPPRAAAREGERSEARNDSAPTGFELEPVPASPAVCEPAAARMAYDEAGPSPTRSTADLGPPGANRRSPFYVVLGLLSAVAVAATGYFWHQLQPAPQMANGRTAPPLPDRAAAVVQSVPAQLAIPGLPVAAPARTAESAAVSARVSSAAAARASASSAQEPAARSAAPQPRNVPPVQQDAARIHSQVEAGYAAFRSGDLDAARAAYQRALREEPDNADAVLGMAALETHAGRLDLAEAHYLRLLQASPRDPYAQAGLLALRTEQVDPLQAESRLKTLLAADPDAIPLNFSLGNQLARQGRWAEAQQAYFRALTGDPDNPDIAFNLAVSLDRLHQSAQAMAYYGRALALAEHRVASFSPEAARLRLQQLAR